MTAFNSILDELAELVGATERNPQGGFLAFCPAHVDTSPSLSVNPGNVTDVVVYCHAGCDQTAVLAALNELRRKPPAPGGQPFTPVKVRPRRIGHCTVEALAVVKKLPMKFLDSLGLNNYQGTVIIPYRLENWRRAKRHRRRWEVHAGNGGSTWTGERGEWVVPYGLWRLSGEGRPFCFIVEGESDCWTLWYAGLPALGVPGASMTHVLEPGHVAQFEWLIVWQEPGNGGEVFVKGCREHLPGVKLRVVRGEDLGAKDPSELWCQDPDVGCFRAKLRQAVRP